MSLSGAGAILHDMVQRLGETWVIPRRWWSPFAWQKKRTTLQWLRKAVRMATEAYDREAEVFVARPWIDECARSALVGLLSARDREPNRWVTGCAAALVNEAYRIAGAMWRERECRTRTGQP